MTGVSRLLYDSAETNRVDARLEQHLDLLRARAGAALAAFGPHVSARGLHSYDSRVGDDEAGAGISLLARCADLVVVGQYDPSAGAPCAAPDFVAHVVLRGGRPVYILPREGLATLPPRRVLLGWDGSAQAARAVSGALPLLRQAGAVHALVVESARHPLAPGDAPGGDLLSFLSRHGVECQLTRRAAPAHQAGAPARIAQALLSDAADWQADLLVMGGYGHARWRALILGGVTRSVLDAMTLPVLMAH